MKILFLFLIAIAEPASAAKPPLFFVHGRAGSSKNFAGLVKATPKLSQYQLYYFSYDDLHKPLKSSAKNLALAILKTREKRITILAHSMGGLVARETLNYLSTIHSSHNFTEIRVITIDTPWHGGTIHSCNRKGTGIDIMIAQVLPKAIMDMRSCSDFFQSVYSVPWPSKFSIEIYFAKEGTQALDYSEGPLRRVPQKIADLFNQGTPFTGNYFEVNFWKAVSTSRQYSDFANALSDRTKISRVTIYEVRELLEKHFPRFPGNHTSVMSSQPQGPGDFPDFLQEIL